MRHIVNYEDFKNEKVEHRLASSAGKGGGKKLVVTIKLFNLATHYEVIKNGIVEYETSLLERAIEYYNSLFMD